ncbi:MULTISPECIES: NAD(P)/FAD-dependent oxidoreductase [unclassified Microbacterium]|uniref:flavin-containing monooxygenase n=1 Tax=unclassified Microbacterium TaxID=2609290 RepID=UPI000CFD97D5|nr:MULTISPECIES: NAD(P)-binding domain-containing protein [unclassified Microbacterium]PQZ56906.1 monooxygenase [Microbacterium sp. MYb43]PQZ79736.1 monooxygenase [Microbacterium sp. MYb40]PRB20163.1 monooxygenase [Microbacterium sp. MYb54]PRB27447.1 monooxygenase [Microbacterium sp. MYb50]PRB67342.1 monooxygenase [Microbacterium sp. MYb24]
MNRYAVIGAGPSGLAAARALQKRGIAVDGYESSHGVGGLWDIENPRSTMYESAHLISSRTTTEFAEFPMKSRVDYPGHRVLKQYFEEYARHFALSSLFRFDTRVTRLEQRDDGWDLTSTGPGGEETRRYAGVVLANGTLAKPNVPTFPGEFAGEVLHTSAYKSPDQLKGKRVLLIGAGNSGCDIAVDAVHHAVSVDMSVRRGYYFVPRYLFGKPSDTLNQGRPLPARIKQAVDSRVLRAFTGDPVRFGFPKPDYRIYESHPIVNTMILNHLGQGDLRIRPDIDRFDGATVHFRDGTSDDYDLVLLATGYTLDYPFVDRKHLHWRGASPRLFLNVFPASFNGLYVMGMIEASGIGWQGRYEQADLLAAYLGAVEEDPARAARFRDRVTGTPWPDVTGGYHYLGLDRMAYYVNKDAYRGAVRREKTVLETPA